MVRAPRFEGSREGRQASLVISIDSGYERFKPHVGINTANLICHHKSDSATNGSNDETASTY